MSAVEKYEPQEDRPGAMVVHTPMDMIQIALSNSSAPEIMSKLFDLQERWEKNQGRKAFDAAMADAKAEFEPILKNRAVDFTSTKGRTNYKFEDMAQIEKQVGPVLAKHGISYRYRVESEPNSPVRVTCVVAHRDGHSEETSLTAGRDDSGNKNSIQAVGSAITYLQRYTLKAALGLAVSNDDDAGKADQQVVKTISEDQEILLREMLESINGDEKKLVSGLRIEHLADLPANRFANVKAMIQKRIHEELK